MPQESNRVSAQNLLRLVESDNLSSKSFLESLILPDLFHLCVNLLYAFIEDFNFVCRVYNCTKQVAVAVSHLFTPFLADLRVALLAFYYQ